jgi:D-ribulokinase
VIGVDVGTANVRAGVFDLSGQLLGVATQDIMVYRSAGGHVEQSSSEIWRAVCMAVRSASSVAGIAAEKIEGVGFDATCSLVVLGADENGLPVGDPQHPDRDIVVWMDHRAVSQAERINAGRHAVLRFVGGRSRRKCRCPSCCG